MGRETTPQETGGHVPPKGFGRSGVFPEVPLGQPLARTSRVRKPGFNSGPDPIVRSFAQDGRPILVVSDSWKGQKSGVVTVLDVLQRQVSKLTGNRVSFHCITPDQFLNISFKYQDLLFGFMQRGHFEKILQLLNPQAIHLAVEGPITIQAKRYLDSKGIPYTTAYHTRLPEYTEAMVSRYSLRLGRWLARGVAWILKKFHSNSKGILVPARSMAERLAETGYDREKIRAWSHGVETDVFHPKHRDANLFKNLKKPISLYVGRIAVEKNIEDFLDMKIPGTKIVIGGGPEHERLSAKYPDAVFLGRMDYSELPKYYASADIFVFPSLTDTFGLVQLEALASGIPVVAYQVNGPIDVITSEEVGVLAQYESSDRTQSIENLTQAWHQAAQLDRTNCRAFAEAHSWEKSTVEFLRFLFKLPKPRTAILDNLIAEPASPGLSWKPATGWLGAAFRKRSPRHLEQRPLPN